ncbi:MAG TPA: hypothetical protein VI356_09550, partial [Myxococcales bacterium]
MLPIAFLGVCDSTNGYREGHDALWRQDLIGLRKHVVSPVFPWGLSGLQFIFSIFDPASVGEVRIELLDPSGGRVFFVDFTS